MKKILTSVLLILVVRSSGGIRGQALSEQSEAARIWEQAIAAKGGRERLHSVRNFVISERGQSLRWETVCVLPDKYWFWEDYRPGVLGLTVRMSDGNKTSYEARYGKKDVSWWHDTGDSEEYGALLVAQLDFLLESQWVRPTIISSSLSRVGRRRVNVVQTMVEGDRVDFVFDQKSHLPIQVKYYDVPRTHVLSDYFNVGGIMMPTRVDYGDGQYKARIELNVQYDESIFLKPPPMEAGPEAWRQKPR